MAKRKQSTTKKHTALDEQATQLAAEIFNLASQYTNDSAVSKFFLTEEISKQIYITAGGISSLVYTPEIPLEEIKDIKILSLFMVLMTYGFQIYLKEHSLKNNAAPYRLPANEKLIQEAGQKILVQVMEGNVVTTPLTDAVIEILLKQVKKNIDFKQYNIPKHTLNQEKLEQYLKIAMYYGYDLGLVLIKR